MFKKPLADLKTSAPLRSSERRKLKQRVLQSFASLKPEDGDSAVPDGLLVQKFKTHLDELGVAYFSPDGDPLWFSIGKGSEDLIPTVYTLWKHHDLLPILTTPAAVIPKLINGADLMIPGVVQFHSTLVPEQLVAVAQYHRDALGAPVAVGRMAVSGEALRNAEEADMKGKAVYVLHTWKDALWELGACRKADAPAPRAAESTAEPEEDEEGDEHAEKQQGNKQDDDDLVANGAEPDAGPSTDGTDEQPSYGPQTALLTPEEVSFALREALLQAITTTLSKLPASAFPIPASTFWSTYILPARPAQPPGSTIDVSKIDAKHSTHKSVKVFLKASAKEGLLKLKEAKGGDVMVSAVFSKHDAVAAHRPYRTVQELDAKQQRAEDRERKEKEAEERRKVEMHVTELYKPFGSTVGWFVAAGKDTSELYTFPDVKDIFNTYITSRNLVNERDPGYINVNEDPALHSSIVKKGEDTIEFMRRDEVFKRISHGMQPWHEISTEGGEPVRKKGQLKPIHVVVKIRQGRKACTLVTGFEPYALVADDLAEELRKLCAGSTSVSPIHGKQNEMEVMVQGKQIKAVTEHLLAKGVPKRWVEGADLTGGKKK